MLFDTGSGNVVVASTRCTDETRALEADSFQNPGMLYVERGEEIWNTPAGSAGKSCATCHGDAAESMRGVAAHYPKWDAATGRPVNIELQIDQCRVQKMGAEQVETF